MENITALYNDISRSEVELFSLSKDDTYLKIAAMLSTVENKNQAYDLLRDLITIKYNRQAEFSDNVDHLGKQEECWQRIKDNLAGNMNLRDLMIFVKNDGYIVQRKIPSQFRALLLSLDPDRRAVLMDKFSPEDRPQIGIYLGYATGENWNRHTVITPEQQWPVVSTNSTTIIANSNQAIRCEPFVSELNIWKNNVLGEDRECVAELTLNAYDYALSNPLSDMKLDLSEKRITELPPLFGRLTILDISSTDVTNLPPNLPEGLINLNISNTQVKKLPDLPSGLTILNIEGTKITKLPAHLPAGLERLHIAQTRVRELPKLSAKLIALDIAQTLITELPPLPSGLTHLTLLESKLKKLPERWPVRLNYLAVSGRDITGPFKNLPAGLTHLCISLTNVTELPKNLPAQLQYLKIAGSKIRELPQNLPTELRYLDISFTGVRELPENLPAQLEYLDIAACEIRELPQNLPAELKFLDISLTPVRELPENLPAQLVNLNMMCTDVRRLPDLPDGLLSLDVGNTLVTDLPNWPRLLVDSELITRHIIENSFRIR
ncbi:MAG: hypothetical protein K0R08_2027 [Solimicrobium sp.]|jgi:Leucine-rich repeat (LRR) protein|nr:hypothetical protein [Solimicrobium sp.]